MTNKLLLCTNCKKRFPRETMIRGAVGNFHNAKCRREYAVVVFGSARVAATSAAKLASKPTLAPKAKNRTERMIREDAAKLACHTYIKARDRNKFCICCNEPLDLNFHAGHFLESGNNPKIRYDEDNINSQRSGCNLLLNGNHKAYESNLRLRIGNVKVDTLIANKGGTVKRTIDDYRVIETYYKRKLKEITE